MEKSKKRRLEKISCQIRKTALEATQAAGSGHLGGSFSIAEILSVLYFDKMNIDPQNPQMQKRDRFVISKGHCSPAVYATLAMRGFFPTEHLKTFRKIDSDLSGHVEMHVPGVDISTGSLGQGLSMALGMAIYSKKKHWENQIYCILGDGEIQEGQIWEAVMAAAHFHTDNLIAFVDNNKLQLEGAVEESMNIYPIGDKFRSFHWNVTEVDGHDVEALSDAIDAASVCKGKPTIIICDSVKGKGVSFMENQVRFHGGHPTESEYAIAYKELDERIRGLEDEAWEKKYLPE